MTDGIHDAVVSAARIEMDGPALVVRVAVDYGESSGEWAFRVNGKNPDGRRPSMADLVEGVLRAAGAGRWDLLVGRPVRVRREGGLVAAIGHVADDVWIDPQAMRREPKEGEPCRGPSRSD